MSRRLDVSSTMLERPLDASGAAFAPSWIDSMVDRVDALPVPAWATYLGVLGMHARIAAEQAHRVDETNRQLDRLLTEVDRRADVADLEEADALKQAASEPRHRATGSRGSAHVAMAG